MIDRLLKIWIVEVVDLRHRLFVPVLDPWDANPEVCGRPIASAWVLLPVHGRAPACLQPEWGTSLLHPGDMSFPFCTCAKENDHVEDHGSHRVPPLWR